MFQHKHKVEALNPSFNVVVAPGIVYIEESMGLLIFAMDPLLGENDIVLLGYQLRSSKAHKLF